LASGYSYVEALRHGSTEEAIIHGSSLISGIAGTAFLLSEIAWLEAVAVGAGTFAVVYPAGRWIDTHCVAPAQRALFPIQDFVTSLIGGE
jgi:hypothetical protein